MMRLVLIGREIHGVYDDTLTYRADAPIAPYTSAGQITFIDGSPSTITDSLSGFVTAGIKSGDVIKVSGSANNNDFLYVADAVAGTLTLAGIHDLTNEAGGAGAVTISTPAMKTLAGNSITLTIGNAHDRLHSINGSSDHNSPGGTQSNVVVFGAAGYPVVDGGNTVAEILDCDNHTSGTTNFVLAQQAAEADLGQTITNPPTQAEVQAISDKIDALLAKLRSANVLAA